MMVRDKPKGFAPDEVVSEHLGSPDLVEQLAVFRAMVAVGPVILTVESMLATVWGQGGGLMESKRWGKSW